MQELKNYAEISFTNPFFIDIFSHYADNKTLAEIVREDGSFYMKFRVNPPIDPPKCCEHVLSLIFALFESNPESRLGKIYMSNQKEILKETVYRLAQVLDGFGNVKLTLHTASPDSETVSHTEFTLTRTKTTSE